MQIGPWKAHIGNDVGRVELIQNVTKFLHVFTLDALGEPVVEVPL